LFTAAFVSPDRDPLLPPCCLFLFATEPLLITPCSQSSFPSFLPHCTMRVPTSPPRAFGRRLCRRLSKELFKNSPRTCWVGPSFVLSQFLGDASYSLFLFPSGALTAYTHTPFFLDASPVFPLVTDPPVSPSRHAIKLSPLPFPRLCRSWSPPYGKPFLSPV